jgi:transposase
MVKYYIKSEDWEKIYKFLKYCRDIRVGNEVKTRLFAEAVYFIMRTGAQWRELPPYYGKWRSVHKRFEDWSRKGLWSQILENFTEGYDGESLMIDATIIRAHPCAAGYEKDQSARECLGRSKGGFTTKIHVVVDALGQALRFSLTPGQRHDITQAPTLLQGFENANIIADKGYDSNALVEQIQKQNCIPVIPPRSNRNIPREYDKHLYKERHLVECFFNKIKHFRRIFSRFDKKASSFAGFIAFASFILWLR